MKSAVLVVSALLLIYGLLTLDGYRPWYVSRWRHRLRRPLPEAEEMCCSIEAHS